MADPECANNSCEVPHTIDIDDDGRNGDLLSAKELDIFITVVIIALCCPISAFGLVANSINLIVFYKQGFTECVNISLFALAISDVGALLTLLYVDISMAPWYDLDDMNIRPRDVAFLIGAWPHICFARVTCWITVFITSERCFCIAMPFKVKSIFVPKLVVSFLVSIFVVSALGIVPVYFSFMIVWHFDESVNKTYLTQTIDPEQFELIGTTYFQIFFQCASFVTITILTVTLVVKLQQNTRWRASATSGGEQTGAISKREKKVIKMIIFITTILIFCYIPSTVLQLVWLFEPRFATGGQFNNTQNACWLFGFLCEGTNSSVNIFVYYNMSSSYRETFTSTFRGKSEGKLKKK